MTSRFDALMLDVRTDPTRADYQALRSAWAECARYRPYGKDTEAVEELHMRVASGEGDETSRSGPRLSGRAGGPRPGPGGRSTDDPGTVIHGYHR